MFDPRDEAALGAALRRVAADAGLRAELRARGFKRAQRFSWERVARETLAVYEQVLS
jgi:glycosyltransferase involved in cell wall biosynthesis